MLKRPILPLFLLLLSQWSFAAAVEIQGKVAEVRTHDATAHPTWAPPSFWFSLKGVTQAGSCGHMERVLFVGNDKQMLTVIVAAQLSGANLLISYDDTVISNGFCKVLHATIVTL